MKSDQDKATAWADAYKQIAKGWDKVNAKREAYIERKRAEYRQFKGETDVNSDL